MAASVEYLRVVQFLAESAERALSGEKAAFGGDFAVVTIDAGDVSAMRLLVGEASKSCATCVHCDRVSDESRGMCVSSSGVDGWVPLHASCGAYRAIRAETFTSAAPAPVALAGGDAKLARGEMPSSATWGDLGRAAKCSRCNDDGQPCSHCEVPR